MNSQALTVNWVSSGSVFSSAWRGRASWRMASRCLLARGRAAMGVEAMGITLLDPPTWTKAIDARVSASMASAGFWHPAPPSAFSFHPHFSRLLTDWRFTSAGRAVGCLVGNLPARSPPTFLSPPSSSLGNPHKLLFSISPNASIVFSHTIPLPHTFLLVSTLAPSPSANSSPTILSPLASPW